MTIPPALIANTAGVPQTLEEDDRASVELHYFCKGLCTARDNFDLDNVQKAIYDALWNRDRRVVESHFYLHEN